MSLQGVLDQSRTASFPDITSHAAPAKRRCRNVGLCHQSSNVEFRSEEKRRNFTVFARSSRRCSSLNIISGKHRASVAPCVSLKRNRGRPHNVRPLVRPRTPFDSIRPALSSQRKARASRITPSAPKRVVYALIRPTRHPTGSRNLFQHRQPASHSAFVGLKHFRVHN